MSSEMELIVTAVASGAAGSLAKETITSGLQWLKDKFAHHNKQAQKKAAENANDFLNELMPMIKKLEENSDFLRKRIETAMSQPDFSALMQQALISAAQTESKEKHILLAQVVSERLRESSDSLLALASQMAVEAISHITSNQLKILGFYYTLEHMRFPAPQNALSHELLRVLQREWLELMLSPYKDLQFTRLDLMHLDALGCLGARHGMILSPGLRGMLIAATDMYFEAEYEQFAQTELVLHLRELFETQNLNGTSLKSTGSLIGMYVADQLANRPTDIAKWEA